MSKILVVSGPEKAGKTTTIAALKTYFETVRGLSVRVRKQSGRAKPHDGIYLRDLLEDRASGEDLVIWDRSWVAESVYGTLLHQDRRLAKTPEYGEFTYGRFVDQHIILLGESSSELAAKRNETDLKVDPAAERQLYAEYAHRFGITSFKNSHDDKSLLDIVEYVDFSMFGGLRFKPLFCMGPNSPDIIIVGDMRDDPIRIPFIHTRFVYLTNLAGNGKRIGFLPIYGTEIMTDLVDSDWDIESVIIAADSEAAARLQAASVNFLDLRLLDQCPPGTSDTHIETINYIIDQAQQGDPIFKEYVSEELLNRHGRISELLHELAGVRGRGDGDDDEPRRAIGFLLPDHDEPVIPQLVEDGEEDE